MGAPRGEEVGGELAELYLKGRDTLKTEIAGEIAAAATSVVNIGVYAAMSRDGDLGIGSSGPYPAFSQARTALYGRINDLADQLETAGINIMKTAQDLADVDQDTARAFTDLGGEFPV